MHGCASTSYMAGRTWKNFQVAASAAHWRSGHDRSGRRRVVVRAAVVGAGVVGEGEDLACRAKRGGRRRENADFWLEDFLAGPG